MPTYNTDEIIKSSLENVTSLSHKLKNIELLYKGIQKVILESAEIPKHFKKLSSDLSLSTENYLSGNNEIFKEQIIEIVERTKDLKIEINKLSTLDFKGHFNNLENKFIENTKVELKKEFDKLDEKTNKLKTISDDFKTEVNRLSLIDLVSHFDKHQNKLSEIFIAINGINGILATLSQNVIRITQSIDDVETLVRNYHITLEKGIEEFIKLSNTNQELTTTKLNEIERMSKANFISIKSQLEASIIKQQTNTYITWGLIVLAVIVLFLIRK